MVVLDATMLLLFLRPDAGIPTDPEGQPVTKPKERVEHLIAELDKAGTRIAIPTPVLSEVLVRADAAAAQAIVERLNKQAIFSVESFDQRAAIEVAVMLRDELKGGKKALKTGPETWAKLKYDRQIVAIAKVVGATTIYSDDGGVAAVAARSKIPVVSVGELPLPPEDPQEELLLYGDPDD
jgi:predicted nucleic acid-binding protein